MGVIHNTTHNLSVYCPPKCGSKMIDQLIDFPEYAGLFQINHEWDGSPRPKMIIVIRNHLDRVLSTYYDKIVDPIGNEWNGWRHTGGPGPESLGYMSGACDTFQMFLMNLGRVMYKPATDQRNPHASSILHDSHLAPYLSQPMIRTALQPGLANVPVTTCFIYTHELDEYLIPTLNQFMGFNDLRGLDRWTNLDIGHSIPYSSELPSPLEYGANRWSQVHRDELYRCCQENGKLPSRKLMWDEFCQNMVQIQIGYQADCEELLKYIEYGRQQDLLALRD